VLRDARKRHQRDPELDSDSAVAERHAAEPSAEDAALESVFLDALRAAVHQGVVSEPALRVIAQTRAIGEPVSHLADRCGINRHPLASCRFRRAPPTPTRGRSVSRAGPMP